MKRISLFLILLLMISVLTGCLRLDQQEKTTTIKEAPMKPFSGYYYCEEDDRYINQNTKDWYLVKDGSVIIPSDQYINPEVIDEVENISIENRPTDVWELSEIEDIIIEKGDTFVDIINPYLMNKHFRMDPEWYTKQVLEINKIDNPHLIREGGTLKLPIYIDIKSK